MITAQEELDNRKYEHIQEVFKKDIYMETKNKVKKIIIQGEIEVIYSEFIDMNELEEYKKKLSEFDKNEAQKLCKLLLDDIKKKRKEYIPENEWDLFLDPLDALGDDFEEADVFEKLKRLLHAEARAEFSKREREIYRKWEAREIKYREYEEIRDKIFEEVYSKITPKLEI